jgi:DNA gyrase inhibitor GyrI
LKISRKSRDIGTKAGLKNELGQAIKTFQINKNKEEIDMSHLPAGLYLLEFFNGKLAKIVKE